jgi:hypothetical protein
MRSWLAVAAGIDGLDGDAFRQAHHAVVEWNDAVSLADDIARAYHDPKLRARYGADAVERAWSDPQTARELLLKESGAGRLPPEADGALRLIYEAQQFAAESGAKLPAPAAKPLPTAADEVDAEYQTLIGQSATGRLLPAEAERLQSLAEARVAAQDRQSAAAEAVGDRKPTPSEYASLIAKSVSGRLSDAEGARLTGLAGERAVAEGRATADDVAEQ